MQKKLHMPGMCLRPSKMTLKSPIASMVWWVLCTTVNLIVTQCLTIAYFVDWILYDLQKECLSQSKILNVFRSQVEKVSASYW